MAEGNCVLVIDYKVIDKLWKNENLLVSALRPYPKTSPLIRNLPKVMKSAPAQAAHAMQ